MSEDHPSGDHLRDELDREERLIHRALEGSAGVGDWAELELLARRDPTVWKRLAISMRGELTLRRAGAAIDDALPALPAGRGAAGGRGPILVGGLGWAAAFLVGLLWLSTSGGPGESAVEGPQLGAHAAWQQYIASADDSGSVVEELSPVMLEARPTADGGSVEVTFLRRAVERTTVDTVHEVVEDDAGRLTMRSVPVPQLVDHETF